MLTHLRRLAPNFVIAWGFAATVAALGGWFVDGLSDGADPLDASGFGLVASTFLFLYIGTIIHLILSARTFPFRSPKLKMFRQGDGYPDGLFQFEPADWLIYNASYAVFLIEDGDFERLLCVARVLVIQDDKKVQLIVTQRAKDSGGIWDQIARAPRDYTEKIIIKPGVPVDV
jgi:hypothetical protein